MIVGALNRTATAKFKAYLGRIRLGALEEPPSALLEDATSTMELALELDVTPTRFTDRRKLGAYLGDLLAPLAPAELEKNTGLWAWLTLYWFDQLCPLRPDGTRRPGADYRHVPNLGQHRYGHLLYGPYHVYRQHGPRSVVLLSGPPHHSGHLYEAITSRQDLIANRSVVEAALLLYVDRRTGRLKRGCQPSSAHPGTIRRFVKVLRQLDVTYDIYGMTGPQILDLLPPEFERWGSTA